MTQLSFILRLDIDNLFLANVARGTPESTTAPTQPGSAIEATLHELPPLDVMIRDSEEFNYNSEWHIGEATALVEEEQAELAAVCPSPTDTEIVQARDAEEADFLEYASDPSPSPPWLERINGPYTPAISRAVSHAQAIEAERKMRVQHDEASTIVEEDEAELAAIIPPSPTGSEWLEEYIKHKKPAPPTLLLSGNIPECIPPTASRATSLERELETQAFVEEAAKLVFDEEGMPVADASEM